MIARVLRLGVRTTIEGPIARDALSLAGAILIFGLSFGVVARDSGLSVLQAQAMSLLVFTGASQFAAVGIVDAGGATATALGTALLLAGRNALYGIAMSPIVRGGLPLRALGAHFVIDETTAMATARSQPRAQRRAFWLTAGWLFVAWNLGTLAGALLGGAVGDPEALGLDVVFPASFVALLGPQLRSRPAVLTAVLAAATAVALVPATRVGVPVLAAAGAAVLVGLLWPAGSPSSGALRSDEVPS